MELQELELRKANDVEIYKLTITLPAGATGNTYKFKVMTSIFTDLIAHTKGRDLLANNFEFEIKGYGK